MSDSISGVKIINPAYPVRPTLPPERDSRSGKRRKDPPRQEPTHENDADDDDDKPTIDEYI